MKIFEKQCDCGATLKFKLGDALKLTKRGQRTFYRGGLDPYKVVGSTHSYRCIMVRRKGRKSAQHMAVSWFHGGRKHEAYERTA